MENKYKINRKHYIVAYIWAVLLCWTIIIPIAIIIYVEIMVRATTYTIDKNSVTKRFKFLAIEEKKISKKDITDISMSQGLIQRMFGLGNLKINTAGTHLIEMRWVGLENPERVRKLIK